MSGKVYLVGAGPGKPDLITVRGANILKQADVVIYDYLVNKKILENVREEAELICCSKLGKKKHLDSSSICQTKINNLLVKKVKQGKNVIRLKSGDPGIFSRLSQELEILAKNKIEFEIVPGVTAASAAACFSGVALTDRKYASSCVFVTGREDLKKKTSFVDWGAIAKEGVIVLYMAVENLAEITGKLLKTGKNRNVPVVVVQNISLVNQKSIVGNLGNIVSKAKNAKLKPPAIIIIGEAAGLEKKFNWLRKGKKILFTGLSKERFFIKGTYFYLPLIKIEFIRDSRKFDSYLKKINDFDWVVFTSRYGVEYFFKRLKNMNFDLRVLKGLKIAAIGSSTKNKLLSLGIRADLVPKNESSKGLIDKFKKEELNGKNIFMPRSDISDKGLSRAFENLGAKVSASVAYKNVMPKGLPDLDLNYFDEIMFTSPSTVRNFKLRYKKLPKKVKVNCIGEVTSKEVKKCKLLG